MQFMPMQITRGYVPIESAERGNTSFVHQGRQIIVPASFRPYTGGSGDEKFQGEVWLTVRPVFL